MTIRRPASQLLLVSATLLFSHGAFAQFLQQGPKLSWVGVIASARPGRRPVAFSADGDTAIVGGGDDRLLSINDGIGAAWIWIRSDGFWVQQGPKLSGVDVVGDARQGMSVAISADGKPPSSEGQATTPRGGAPGSGRGAPEVWAQQGPKFVSAGGPQPGDVRFSFPPMATPPSSEDRTTTMATVLRGSGQGAEESGPSKGSSW